MSSEKKSDAMNNVSTQKVLKESDLQDIASNRDLDEKNLNIKKSNKKNYSGSDMDEEKEEKQEELEEIIKNSANNANMVGSKILEDANASADNIGKNSLKLVENKEELMKNDIVRRVSKASVEIAKNQIIQELNNNKDLHKKLIEESIEAIDGVEF